MDSDGAGFLDVFWDGDRLTFRIAASGARVSMALSSNIHRWKRTQERMAGSVGCSSTVGQ